MSDAWTKQDRPCPPCPRCGASLYEKFWGNGGWVKTERAIDRMHSDDRCAIRLREALTRLFVAYESMRAKFGDEYEGRFLECDEMMKAHDESLRLGP